MQDWLKLQNRMWRTGLEAFELQTAAYATISARLPMIAAAATGLADHAARRETSDMVTEKIAAASEGVGLGAIESAMAAVKIFYGDSSPAALAGHAIDVAAAATRPARRQVRANARRLVSWG